MINITQAKAGPCATVYAATAKSFTGSLKYVQGKTSGQQSAYAVNDLFSGMDGCAQNKGCVLADATSKAGFSIKNVNNVPTVVNNWNAAGIKSTAYTVNCTYNLGTKAAKDVMVSSTFTWGYDACTTASQSSLAATTTTPTYTPQGGIQTAFYKNSGSYESLFFANTNCPSSASSSDSKSVRGVAAAADCDPNTITVANPAHGLATLFQTGAAPAKTDTQLNLKNDVQGGYQAQLKLGSCTPKGATKGFAAAAATATYEQKCYQVLTAKPATATVVLQRGTGSQALFATSGLLSEVFTGYDAACDSISSVSSSLGACPITVTAAKLGATNTTPTYSTACSLETAAGYDQSVTVTVHQANNPAYSSTFKVSLPAGASGGSSSSKTTAVVLGVIGGVVGLGIIGGVAWYVIKGRNNGDVDPYDDDATTGLNQQEHA